EGVRGRGPRRARGARAAGARGGRRGRRARPGGSRPRGPLWSGGGSGGGCPPRGDPPRSGGHRWMACVLPCQHGTARVIGRQGEVAVVRAEAGGRRLSGPVTARPTPAG